MSAGPSRVRDASVAIPKDMTARVAAWFLGSGAALLIAVGCSNEGSIADPSDGGIAAGDASQGNPSDAAPSADAGCPAQLLDNPSVYADDDLEVQLVELTVADLEGLAAVEENVIGAEVRAIFRSGSFGAGAEADNATLELRGQSTRLAGQKSFKIHIDSEAGLWRGQREVNLNKHPYDLSRVRNRLSFDLFRAIPHLTSLRTEFVHLVINGESRGLYTQVEEADKRFLANHGLDPQGTLYKAHYFSFRPLDPDEIANPELLALRLEAKANADTAKLVRMVDALDEPIADIDAVIDTHFDRENYLTWLATNLLVGNFDTTSQNFYLYSPSQCERWYFLPWDYDGAFGFYEQPGNPPRARRRAGLANWWDSGLHNPFFTVPANVDAIEARMAELRTTALADDRITALLDGYRAPVRAFISVEPDVLHLPVLDGTATPTEAIEQWGAEYDRIAGIVGDYVDEYDAVRERPMPVWLYGVSADRALTFDWSSSYDMQGDGLQYDLIVSSSPDFEADDIIAEVTGLSETEATISIPDPGEYYWHVITRDDADPDDNWQMSFIDDEMFVVE
jgi:spore coat protein H